MEYVKVAHLKEGDVVAKTIYNDKLQVLLREGGTLTKAGILNIRNQGYKGCYIEHDGSERREDVLYRQNAMYCDWNMGTVKSCVDVWHVRSIDEHAYNGL